MLSHVGLFATPWTVTCQAPLSMGFFRQEYWNGLPFPSPGNLPDAGIEPMSPVLVGGFFTTEPLGSEGTKSGSSLWSSSPTPRHRSTQGISEQDRCPVWAHLSVRACALAHARWPARQGVGRGLGLWRESVQAPGLPRPAPGCLLP